MAEAIMHLWYEEAESIESKFQCLLDVTDTFVGRYEKSEGLRLKGDNLHCGKDLGAGIYITVYIFSIQYSSIFKCTVCRAH